MPILSQHLAADEPVMLAVAATLSQFSAMPLAGRPSGFEWRDPSAYDQRLGFASRGFAATCSSSTPPAAGCTSSPNGCLHRPGCAGRPGRGLSGVRVGRQRCLRGLRLPGHLHVGRTPTPDARHRGRTQRARVRGSPTPVTYPAGRFHPVGRLSRRTGPHPRAPADPRRRT